MTHVRFVGLCVGLILLGSIAKAEHYVPEEGEIVSVGAYCETIADAKAIVLSGFPSPIPDDIDCWFANQRLIGFSEGKVDEIEEFDIIAISNLAAIDEYSVFIFLEGGERVFIPARRHEKDA